MKILNRFVKYVAVANVVLCGAMTGICISKGEHYCLFGWVIASVGWVALSTILSTLDFREHDMSDVSVEKWTRNGAEDIFTRFSCGMGMDPWPIVEGVRKFDHEITDGGFEIESVCRSHIVEREGKDTWVVMWKRRVSEEGGEAEKE